MTLAPEDGATFEEFSRIELQWEAAGILGPDEWYAVRLNWLENGERQFGGTNIKETTWIVPHDAYYARADQGTGRVYEWTVFVEKVTEDEDGEKTGRPVSATSEPQTFFWP